MCKYDDINEDNCEKQNKNSRKIYFFRQLLVCGVVWIHYFTTGLCFGAPTVLIPQIRKEMNETLALNEEMTSWLCSAFGFSAIPWVFIIPLTISHIGRKITYVIICANMLAALIALYVSNSPTQILVSEAMQGMNHAANVTVSIIIITEYTSPKYRGIFLTIKSATFFWGVWVSNAIGTFFHWKYIPLFGFFCGSFTILSIFWPESPYWLATKGRFNECRAAHKWLHGLDKHSKSEVENLILSQARYLESCDSRKPHWKFSTIVKTVLYKEFYKPVFVSFIMVTQYHLSGKYMCSMYAIDIIKKITKNEDTAYTGMLILDGVTVFGMYIGCFLSNILKRRTLYLLSSSIGISFLFLIALYLYLIEFSILEERNIASILLLIAFSVPISCGPMIMTTSIYGEIIPLKYKTASFLITALVNEIYSTSLLKVAPFIFRSLGLHGAFLIYGIAAGFCTFLLYIFLPETKDKTLQEIAEYFTSQKEKLNIDECMTHLQSI